MAAKGFNVAPSRAKWCAFAALQRVGKRFSTGRVETLPDYRPI